MQTTRPRGPGRRLEMLLDVGTRFRLFGNVMPERTWEVVGFVSGRWGRPDARVLVRPAGSHTIPWGYGEARRSVERWVLRELARGGWPWP